MAFYSHDSEESGIRHSNAHAYRLCIVKEPWPHPDGSSPPRLNPPSLRSAKPSIIAQILKIRQTFSETSRAARPLHTNPLKGLARSRRFQRSLEFYTEFLASPGTPPKSFFPSRLSNHPHHLHPPPSSNSAPIAKPTILYREIRLTVAGATEVFIEPQRGRPNTCVQ
jgi:hypothetical protein